MQFINNSMKLIKKICIFGELLFCIAANAQQKITNLSPIPDATKQTIEQYISTHSIDEMNKDTVVLSNIYSLIGYSCVDKYLGETTGSFIVVGQDYQYKDLKLQSNEKLLYVLTENGYEQTPVDKEIIKKKIRGYFALNDDNSYFYRNDTFVVKAINIDGKKNIFLHCISYPRKYILDFDSDKKKAPKIDRKELINIE